MAEDDWDALKSHFSKSFAARLAAMNPEVRLWGLYALSLESLARCLEKPRRSRLPALLSLSLVPCQPCILGIRKAASASRLSWRDLRPLNIALSGLHQTFSFGVLQREIDLFLALLVLSPHAHTPRRFFLPQELH